MLMFQGVWYTPGRYRHPATGFLEERLRNIRKRLHSHSSASGQRSQTTNERRATVTDRITLLPGKKKKTEGVETLLTFLIFLLSYYFFLYSLNPNCAVIKTVHCETVSKESTDFVPLFSYFKRFACLLFTCALNNCSLWQYYVCRYSQSTNCYNDQLKCYDS